MQPTDEIIAAQRAAVRELIDYTADQLDTIGASGNTVLLANYVYSEPFQNIELAGGWIASFVGRTEVGAVGKILLIPKHEWTRVVWRKGQVDKAVAKGLTTEQANRWIESRVNQRHRMFDLLLATINDKEAVAAYMAYDVNGDSNDSLRWSAHNSINDQLQHNRRVIFIQLLRDVLDLNPEPEFTGRPIMKGDSSGIVLRPWEDDAA